MLTRTMMQGARRPAWLKVPRPLYRPLYPRDGRAAGYTLGRHPVVPEMDRHAVALFSIIPGPDRVRRALPVRSGATTARCRYVHSVLPSVAAFVPARHRARVPLRRFCLLFAAVHAVHRACPSSGATGVSSRFPIAAYHHRAVRTFFACPHTHRI